MDANSVITKMISTYKFVTKIRKTLEICKSYGALS